MMPRVKAASMEDYIRWAAYLVEIKGPVFMSGSRGTKGKTSLFTALRQRQWPPNIRLINSVGGSREIHLSREWEEGGCGK